MFIQKLTPYVRTPRLKDKDGFLVFARPVDQFSSQDFNRSFVTNLPANDITLLSRATSQREYDMILSRLTEVRVNQPDNSKKSDKQIVSEIMPSWVQSPSEIERFMDYYNSLHPNQPAFEPANDQVSKSDDSSESSSTE